MERPSALTLHGNPLTLVGSPLTVGNSAPAVTLRNVEMQPVTLADLAGKAKVFVVVPSLDTPVCEKEAKVFHERATELSGDVHVYVVSRDTVFAQKRYCAAHGVDRVTTLSDHIDGNLGKAWGLYIKENGLDARAVVILDATNTVRYHQLVPALEQEPNYDEALEAAKAVASA